ncbi:uncharacterized protein LOC133302672 [Gastrolobium bilobum]|uniref:uncharacterized protein LOC133302672 n=1 Tax=Gastrolobium bilobum TaxID=150636 RepID=UPI002AB2287B|nr:uncharacterized protein LOC133302672 [Gastrolobium bilobum]
MRGTLDTDSLQFDPEIEKTAKRNRKLAKERRQQEKEASSSIEPREEAMGDNNVPPPPPRTLGDYMTPARVPRTASIVRPNVDANNFELKPALLQLIQKDQFAGGSTEDPYIHLENFLLYCDTLKMNGVSWDAILLRLFPCSLKDDPRGWRVLKTKTPEEALELLESLASQEYDNAPVPQRRARIMKLDGYDAILAQNEQILQINKKQQEQLDALTKQFTSSQVSSVNNIQITCDICAGAHATEDCRAPETADVNGIWHDQKAPYNPGRNRYGNNQNQGEDTSAFMQETKASFRNLETQIGQLSRQFTERVQGTFPGNTIPNPSREHYNAITIMSEKAIEPVEKEKEVAKESAAEKTVPEKKEFKWEKKKAQERQEKSLELSPYAKIPYPQSFREEIQKQQYSRFLDIFKKLQINIPFTEALENMPNYVKFMKDLLSRKRKLQECETVTLTEECSAIIQKKLPPKIKDPTFHAT